RCRPRVGARGRQRYRSCVPPHHERRPRFTFNWRLEIWSAVQSAKETVEIFPSTVWRRSAVLEWAERRCPNLHEPSVQPLISQDRHPLAVTIKGFSGCIPRPTRIGARRGFVAQRVEGAVGAAFWHRLGSSKSRVRSRPESAQARERSQK